MIFQETELPGCYTIEPDLIEDERGFFARTFDAEEFRRRGMNPRVAQSSISHNRKAGTLRGLHYQAAPHQEAKLVRCLRGRVLDVVIDLRLDLPTYLHWQGFELSSENRTAVYVPEGLAHGYLTLVDDSEVLYQISVGYEPELARGLRWDDPRLGIDWPGKPLYVSSRDAGFPLLLDNQYG